MKLAFTHLDKVYFPQGKITKGDLIEYYRFVAKRMLPFLKDRPLVIERYPSGIRSKGVYSKGFYQKNVQDYFPPWIKTIKVERSEKGEGNLVNCDQLDTLLYLVNLGTVTFHTWLSKKSQLRKPDKLVFDLDPPQGKFDLACEAALCLKDLLEGEYKLKTFLMTTGSKGLHVVIPIKPLLDFEEVRNFAREIAQMITDENPKLFTTNVRKTGRRGRVYIDVMRNAYAQHSVAPYSVRPTKEASIAMPISWKDLSSIHPKSFTLLNIHEMALSNPWRTFFTSAKKIPR